MTPFTVEGREVVGELHGFPIVIRHAFTGTAYTCAVLKEGEFYVADISNTVDAGPECMIFKIVDGDVRYEGIHCHRFNSVSIDNLILSVNEFLTSSARSLPPL